MVDLPWNPQDSPQVKGRKNEAPRAKKIGARLHPNSGAGTIKFDMSTDDAVIEMKTANKSYTMNQKYLESIFQNAVRQGKDAVLLIEFPDLVVTAHITRNA